MSTHVASSTDREVDSEMDLSLHISLNTSNNKGGDIIDFKSLKKFSFVFRFSNYVLNSPIYFNPSTYPSTEVSTLKALIILWFTMNIFNSREII